MINSLRAVGLALAAISAGCTEDAAPSSDGNSGGCNVEGGACEPLDESAIDAIHSNLMLPSLTAPPEQRVTASKPAESFLLDKAADIQNKQGYACMPQDPNVQSCGTGMPPSRPEDALCAQRGGQERFDIIAAWVLQGALNDRARILFASRPRARGHEERSRPPCRYEPAELVA